MGLISQDVPVPSDLNVHNIQIQPSPKAELAFFFSPHVSRAQHLALARTRTQVIRLGAQCTDHWTTRQSHGIDMPAVQLTMHSTLYGRPYGHKSKFFQLDGLPLPFCTIMGLHSASSAITECYPDQNASISTLMHQSPVST